MLRLRVAPEGQVAPTADAQQWQRAIIIASFKGICRGALEEASIQVVQCCMHCKRP